MSGDYVGLASLSVPHSIFVSFACSYPYSSARNYAGPESLVEIIFLNFRWKSY